jgi:uncharacterized LabA/DUF88 family protein
MADRVIVFVDYQNLWHSARNRFGGTGHIWPRALGEVLVERRTRDSTLAGVRLYRGLPSPDRQSGAHRANERQAAVWDADPLVTVIRRPLQYPRDYPDQPAREKGIDVQIAVDLIRLATQGAYQTAIVFSRDTDLVPAIEAIRQIKTIRAHIEVAGWAGDVSQIRLPGLWCHRLTADDYDTVYARPA